MCQQIVYTMNLANFIVRCIYSPDSMITVCVGAFIVTYARTTTASTSVVTWCVGASRITVCACESIVAVSVLVHL